MRAVSAGEVGQEGVAWLGFGARFLECCVWSVRGGMFRSVLAACQVPEGQSGVWQGPQMASPEDP